MADFNKKTIFTMIAKKPPLGLVDAYHFSIIENCFDVISEDNMEPDGTEIRYYDIESNLEIDFMKFPKIWKRFQNLTMENQSKAFILLTANEIIKEINKIKNIKNYYYSQRLLSTEGKIDWMKYDLYQSFRKCKEGFDVRERSNQIIDKTGMPLHFWYLQILHESPLNKFEQISKQELLELASPNENLIVDYLEKYEEVDLYFQANIIEDDENNFRLIVIMKQGEPIAFFIKKLKES